MSSPRVSIGMPVYNGEKYIDIAIRTTLSQTYRDFELIISDNASTDKTESICREFAKNEARIKYYRNEENLGGPANYNKVFELSCGQYFKWSNVDDYVAEDMLCKSVEVLDNRPDVVLCYTKTTLIDEHGGVIDHYEDNLDLQFESAGDRLIKFLESVRLAHQLEGLCRVSALEKTALFGYHFGSDNNLLGELALQGKFFEIQDRLFFRRLHPDALNWDRDDLWRKLKFHNPKFEKKIFFNIYRRHFEYIFAVNRTQIPFKEKLRLYKYLVKKIMLEKNYKGDLKDGLRIFKHQYIDKFRSSSIKM